MNYKIALYTVLLCLTTSLLNANQQKPRSVEGIFQHGSDLIDNYPSEAEGLLPQLYDLATGSKKNLDIALVYVLDAKIQNSKKVFKKAAKLSDKALDILSKGKDDDYKAEALFEKGYALGQMGYQDSCILFLKTASLLIADQKESKLSGKINRSIGRSYWGLGDFKNGIRYTEEAIRTFLVLKDSLNTSKAYNTMGAIHWGLSNYKTALESYFQAILFIESHPRKINQLILYYNNVGLVYRDWKYMEKASEYFRKAMALISEADDPLSIAYTHLNMGSHYINQGNPEKALDELNKATEGYANLGDINGVCLCKIRMAQSYRLMKNHSRAEQLLMDAMADGKRIQNRNRIAIALEQLALNAWGHGQTDLAIEYAQESLDIAEEAEYKTILGSLYHLLSQIYSSTGDFENAYLMLENAEAINNQIYDKKFSNHFELMQLNREFEQKEFENIQLLSENQFNKRVIRELHIAVFLSVLLLLLALSLYYRLYIQKKNLVAANKAKDKIFSIVSHDLRGPVGNLNNIIDLMVKDELKESKSKMLNLFKPIITNTYNLLENLLVWSKSNLGKLEFSGENIEINSTIRETFEPLIPLAEKKTIQILFQSKEEHIAFADKVMFQTVLRNLINNAIKFTSELGTIRINTEETNKFLVISVEDNGIGIPQHKLKSMFDGNKHRLGTNNETGSGIGLIISKELAEMNGGSLWVNSIEGQGTNFYFSVPIKSLIS